MKQHTPFHWITVAAVAAAAAFTLGEAWGQSTGPQAVFEGRPAMAGAQAGQNALAGPPQGGLGVQGFEAQTNGVNLRPPAGLSAMGRVPRDPGVDTPKPTDDRSTVKPQRDRDAAAEVKKEKRPGRAD